MIEMLPLSTTILAVLTTFFTGVFRKMFDRAETWHPLAVQALVGVLALAFAAAANYVGLIPEGYRSLGTTLLQALVAALGAVGINNVKDAVVYGSAGVPKATDVYVAQKTTDTDKL